MIDPAIVKQLRGMREWAVVAKHIEDTVDSLDTLAGIDGDENLIALEVKARQRARQTLIAILQPFVDFRDAPSSSQRARDRAEDAGL